MTPEPLHTTRRRFLTGAAGLATTAVLPAGPARATPEAMKEVIRKAVGEAEIRGGRVKLDLPPLVENGNTVPVSVTVDSPMTKDDYVKAIRVFTEMNPQPYVADFHLGPRAGRARVSTRMRLADTQTVIAIAELSDGTFWSDSAHVVVTLAACLEGAI